MFHYLILILLLPFIFGNFLDDQNHQYPCFCNCCASKPCSLKMQNRELKVNNCDICGQSCRDEFSACQSVNDVGKVFELCSASVDAQEQFGRNDYRIVKAADALLDIIENNTILQSQLDELRRVYDERVKNGTTDDQIPDGNYGVQV